MSNKTVYSVDIGPNDNEPAQRFIVDAQSPNQAMNIAYAYFPHRRIDYIGHGINAPCFHDTPIFDNKDYSSFEVAFYLRDLYGKGAWVVDYQRYDPTNNKLPVEVE